MVADIHILRMNRKLLKDGKTATSNRELKLEPLNKGFRIMPGMHRLAG